MSMNRSTKTRLQAFEEEYAKSIVDTMRLTERNSSNNLGINLIFLNHYKS